MPRTKAVPTKKRSREDEDAELLAAAQRAIERGERDEVARWEACVASPDRHVHWPYGLPEAAAGLVKLSLPAEDHATFCVLHDAIKARHASKMAGWGGTDDRSGRLRCYGYVRSPIAERHYTQSHAMREYDGAKAELDREANRRASTMLERDELPNGFDAALANLCARVAEQVPAVYRSAVSPEQLVAAQPNLHNGQRYLKPHLDEPLHDGFGVVIVTVAVRGAAHVLLQSSVAAASEEGLAPADADAAARHCFRLDAAACEAYVLSGAARNACLHGVLSVEGSEARESLNLRFGLHSAGPGDDAAWPATDVAFA